jgi:hypothetical protein
MIKFGVGSFHKTEWTFDDNDTEYIVGLIIRYEIYCRNGNHEYKIVTDEEKKWGEKYDFFY